MCPAPISGHIFTLPENPGNLSWSQWPLLSCWTTCCSRLLVKTEPFSQNSSHSPPPLLQCPSFLSSYITSDIDMITLQQQPALRQAATIKSGRRYFINISSSQWQPTTPSTTHPPVSLQTNADFDWENISNVGEKVDFFTTTRRTTLRTTTLTAKQKYVAPWLLSEPCYPVNSIPFLLYNSAIFRQK